MDWLFELMNWNKNTIFRSPKLFTEKHARWWLWGIHCWSTWWKHFWFFAGRGAYNGPCLSYVTHSYLNCLDMFILVYIRHMKKNHYDMKKIIFHSWKYVTTIISDKTCYVTSILKKGVFHSNALTTHNGVIKRKHFRVTGHLCGEFTGHRPIPLTKASDAELWCFLWSAPRQTIE